MNTLARSRIAAAATRVLWSLPLFLLLLASTSCTSIQPIQKIGLVAPFEGLYRQTGYASLDAVRMAIEECTPAGYAVIPLALDDSAQTDNTVRSVEKLRQDPGLMAIVGPYDYATTIAAASVLSDTAVPWFSPLAIDANGEFAGPQQIDRILDELVQRMTEYAVQQGAERVYVVGAPNEWARSQVSDKLSFEILTIDRSADPMEPNSPEMSLSALSDVGPDDAILWLGQAHAGAELASVLHVERPESAFWLSPASDVALFWRHYDEKGEVYWVSWTVPEYNSELKNPNSGAALSQLSYLAACEVLSTQDDTDTGESTRVQLSAYRLNADVADDSLTLEIVSAE